MGECAFFNEERKIYVEKLKANPILSDQHNQSLPNPEFLTQLTLDVTVIPDFEDCDSLIQKGWGRLNCVLGSILKKFMRDA